MKMEADLLKLSSSKTSDTGGLTFGPAWLRQLSSGDANKPALPPSPGLAFQLSKHRYSREEMLAIYETIEKSLMQLTPPSLVDEFEELHKKDVQRPVLLTPPSSEEQKFLSTCVNSQAVLNTYNKMQGSSSSGSSTNHSSGSGSTSGAASAGAGDGGGASGGGGAGNVSNSSSSSRGGGMRGGGSRGGGRAGLGGGPSERGGGRGRGRGRGNDFKSIDEEGNPAVSSSSSSNPTSSSTRSGGGTGPGAGGAKGAYKGSGGGGGGGGGYSRSNNWEDREASGTGSGGGGTANAGSSGVGAGIGGGAGKKEYSRAMTEENWRNRAPAVDNDEPRVNEEYSSTTGDSSSAKLSSVADSNEKKHTDNHVASNNSSSNNNSTANVNSTSEKTTNKNWRNSSEKTSGLASSSSSNVNSGASSSGPTREWPSTTSSSTSSASASSKKTNNDSIRNAKNNYSESAHGKRSSNDRNPEWINDEADENPMTFENGKFVSVKEVKSKKVNEEKPKLSSSGERPAAKESSVADGSNEQPTSKAGKSKETAETTTTPSHDESAKATPPSDVEAAMQQHTGDKASLKSLENNSSDPQQLQRKSNNSNQNLINNGEQNPMISQLQLTNSELLNSVQTKLKQQQQHQQLQAAQFQLDENLNITNQKLNQMSLNEFAIQNLQSSTDPLALTNALLGKNLHNQTSGNSNNSQNTFDNLQNIQNIQPQQQQQQQQMKNDYLPSSSVNMDPKRGAVLADHPEADKWFYLDPQNQIQGSFSSEQMAGWFAAGYFSLNLMIKRGCDEKFLPLGAVSQNWGRIPFTSGPQPLPQQQQQQPTQPQVQQPQQSWSKEQIMQQLQVFQRLQQMQMFPQNLNLLRNEFAQQPNMTNLAGIVQQLQQLQLQQNAASAAAASLGPNAVASIIQDLRSQQEALINQFALSNNTNPMNAANLLSKQQQLQQHLASSLPDLDPAILGAAPAATSMSQSIWGDSAPSSRISPITTGSMNPTPPPHPVSISPMNNLIHPSSSSSSLSSATGTNNPLAAFAAAANMDSSILNASTASLVQQIHAMNNANNNAVGNNANNNNNPNMMNINNTLQMLNDNSIKDKIQLLFEQTKKEEERRRKQEEYQMKLKREEDDKRRILEELRAKEEEQRRLQEEERKEQQRKKLEEIIKKQEEDKRKNDEMKKKKEEENKQKQKEEKLKQKQKEEQKKIELQQQEEAEKRRLNEQQTELAKKHAEAEKQKLKYQQEQLNNLQLPAHANWAKSQTQQQQQQQTAQLKSILEQQALESMQQRLLEQQKQAELMAAMQQNSGGSWSSLFRGNPQAQAVSPTSSLPPPAVAAPSVAATVAPLPNVSITPAATSSASASQSSHPVSLLTIQAEQTKLDSTTKQPATMSQKIQSKTATTPVSKQQPQQPTTWAAWGNSTTKPSGTNSETAAPVLSNANSNTGFWTELNEKKPSNNSSKNSNSNNKNTKNQFPDLAQQNANHNSSHHQQHHNNDAEVHYDKASSKHAKKVAAIEESVQATFRNMTISDEFMKWCQEQLRDFHVDLHIPTFVNFLREIETCSEIEDYVINYLGDTKQAKDFAQQFYINRESQFKQQTNYTDDQLGDDMSSQFSKDGQFYKQKQKKRSKGQRVDHQLLGFTVQPDPNLKNRGDIDTL